ncbi:MAG: aldo/keto reductase [Nannocystis sp.]|nr:aldo/keto reductase [Nannocystis sp.]MBA3545249.1 aldo/keto reductase [Nannocystis sp.]
MTGTQDTNTNNIIPSLTEYALLGRSGLRVSPLCLGTMTFGTEFGWGSPKATAHRILDRYLEAGGNFVDTADFYTGGTSERIIGEYLAETGRRDDVVLATKFTLASPTRNPNAGGNGRTHALRALDASLRRLRTDHVDLYWLHAWDTLTPVEEVVRTLDLLVRSGKVRHVGLSDVPAWYFARAQTLAAQHGLEPICALQLEYSLVERTIEREHVPAAIELGAAICPWSPLASGLLTGKYSREGTAARGEGRFAAVQGEGIPIFDKFLTDRNWAIVEALRGVANELGQSLASVALSWITRRPGIGSTLIGATKLAQLDECLRALELEIPTELAARLEAASRPDSAHPYFFFEPAMQRGLAGGVTVRAEQPWYRPRG